MSLYFLLQNKSNKQTVENAQMLLLGSKLYRLTGDKSLLVKIEKIWQVKICRV